MDLLRQFRVQLILVCTRFHISGRKFMNISIAVGSVFEKKYVLFVFKFQARTEASKAKKYGYQYKNYPNRYQYNKNDTLLENRLEIIEPVRK